MDNNKCEIGNIRYDVAVFIDNHPILSKYEGKDYYRIEDDLVAFVESILEKEKCRIEK